MSKKLLIGIVVFVILVFVVGVYYLKFSGNQNKTQKVYQVGILSGLDYFSDVTTGFKEKMTQLGYIEGKNIIYDLHETNFDTVAFKDIIEKFINDKVDMILVFPTEPAQEAKSLTSGTKIPVVFVGANVEDVGLIKSVQEPGSNITGVRWTGSDVALLRYEIMHQLVPQAKRFLIPYQIGVPIVDSQLKAIRLVAEKQGIIIKEIPANNSLELKDKLNALETNNKDAILFILETLAISPEGLSVLDKFATEHKIPLGGTYIPSVNYQMLFGMNPNNTEMGQQAATLAGKILKGFIAGQLPVSSAEIHLIINYKAIKKMGLTVDEGLLSRADEIIQ